MGLNYRCSKRRACGVRRTLKRPIDAYVYRPKCRGCGQDSLLPVYEKERERSLVRGCFCQGPRWPHNKGRIEDDNHVCVHVEDPEGILLAISMNVESINQLRPDAPCPF